MSLSRLFLTFSGHAIPGPRAKPSSPSELPSRPHALAAVALTACLALGQALPAHARSQASPNGKTPAAAAVSYQEDPRVADLARDLAEKEGLDPIWVEQWLRQARYVPQVAQLMMPAPTGTAKNWQAYRARFVESRRIEAGRQFAQTHSRWLALAQERYGVEPEIVLGILGHPIAIRPLYISKLNTVCQIVLVALALLAAYLIGSLSFAVIVIWSSPPLSSGVSGRGPGRRGIPRRTGTAACRLPRPSRRTTASMSRAEAPALQPMPATIIA